MKTNFVVARVGRYSRSDIKGIQIHNDRMSDSHKNPDIVPERSVRNIEFIARPDDELYTEAFDRMVANKIISTSGLKGDAYIMNEIMHDVNSEYWLSYAEHGFDSAEEFAKAYCLDCLEFDKQRFGEQNIISAKFHADEINRELTEKYGFDVWHYHMHVVAIPTVVKEKRWTKRCKDPTLVGKVKERINQVSESKFWQSTPGEDLSYTVFQNDIYDFLKGKYVDLERGEKNSKRKHLDVPDYKDLKDSERALKKEIEALKNANLQLKEENKELLREREVFLAEVKKLEEDLQELIDFEPEELEIEIPQNKVDFVNWCVSHIKGVFEAIYAFCSKQYEIYKKTHEKSILGELEGIKERASSLQDKISNAAARTTTFDRNQREEKERER